MKIMKYDFCRSCRKLPMNPDFTLEEFLDGKGYNAPGGFMFGNPVILTGLEGKGGCSSCISMFKRAMQLETMTTPPDILSALRKKAKSGDPEAMLNLAMKLSFDSGYENNEDLNEEANSWIEKAANLGNAEAQLELSGVYLNEKNDELKAFEWLEKSAKNGYTKAKHNLATYYFSVQNMDQAFYWMEQASNEGHAAARRKLGFLYIEGMGVTVDINKGFSLIVEAAEMGDEEAKKLLEDSK